MMRGDRSPERMRRDRDREDDERRPRDRDRDDDERRQMERLQEQDSEKRNAQSAIRCDRAPASTIHRSSARAR